MPTPLGTSDAGEGSASTGVLALDAFYQHDASTHIRGTNLETVSGAPQRVPFTVAGMW